MVVVGESVDTDVDTVVCAAVVDTNGVVIAPAKKCKKKKKNQMLACLTYLFFSEVYFNLQAVNFFKLHLSVEHEKSNVS